MPQFGGATPFPRRFGGHKPRLKTLIESLNQSRGTAYDVSQSSNVFAENMAIARALINLWSGNARLTNQWDPNRVTDFLARWESILQAPPAPGDSPRARRQRIAGKLKAATGPTVQVIADSCAALLGSVFVQVEYTPLANAAMLWPGNGNANYWYSTTAHILVKVKQPTNMSDAAFTSLMNSLIIMLDPLLPAYVTIDWAITNSSGGNGFLLDDTHNLDYESFDV